MYEESLKDSKQHQGILETMSALSMARVQVPRNFSDAVVSHVIIASMGWRRMNSHWKRGRPTPNFWNGGKQMKS